MCDVTCIDCSMVARENTQLMIWFSFTKNLNIGSMMFFCVYQKLEYRVYDVFGGCVLCWDWAVARGSTDY